METKDDGRDHCYSRNYRRDGGDHLYGVLSVGDTAFLVVEPIACFTRFIFGPNARLDAFFDIDNAERLKFVLIFGFSHGADPEKRGF
jgi:hypothetical protein